MKAHAPLIAAASLLAALFILSPAAAFAASSPWKLKVVAVSETIKEKLTQKEGSWSPGLALSLPEVKDRVEIDERTEFYAFLIDQSKKAVGKWVTFYCYHSTDKKLFAEPVTRLVNFNRGSNLPYAAAYFWSSPSTGGKLFSRGFSRSVMSRSDWNKSRCYGPRTVRVKDKDGKVLAERSFAIHQPGVKVY